MDDIDDIEQRLAPYEVTGFVERPGDFSGLDDRDPLARFVIDLDGSPESLDDGPLAEVIDFMKYRSQRQTAE